MRDGHELVTPEELARRALRALRAMSLPGEDGARDPLRVVLLIGPDASPVKAVEFSNAVRRALLDASIRKTRVRVHKWKALAESRVEIEREPCAPRIQARDRDLLGLLGTARYLTTRQISTLFFPGRVQRTPRQRLQKLRQAAGRGYIKVEHYPGLEGERVPVWSLTHAGYEIAERAAHVAVNFSTEPVRSPFLEHLIWLNELLVALALASGVPVRPAELPFRWQYGNPRPLSFRGRGPDGTPVLKQVIPDAIVDFTEARRRIFVEAECGTHTIVPSDPAKAGATVVKLERYEAFFGDIVDPPTRATAYHTHFQDGFFPELLFMVRTATRRDRVRRAIEERRRKDPGPPSFDVEVLTLAEASERYLPLVNHGPAKMNGAKPSSEFTSTEVGAMCTAFDALLRKTKAAQAAGLGPLTTAEVDAVSEARAVLARLDRNDRAP